MRWGYVKYSFIVKSKTTPNGVSLLSVSIDLVGTERLILDLIS